MMSGEEIYVPSAGWRPRRHQEALWRHLERGGKRAIAVWHRRAGKDEICLHHAAKSMMIRPGNYWHCLPEYSMGRKAIWTSVNSHTGKRRIDEAFPLAIRESTNDQEMFIRTVNGSTWQLIGSDRYDATVGAGTAGITYSEWALANPSAWGYHRPMLQENDGWAIFITTPRGRNHAKALYDHAQLHPHEWFSERLTAIDTGALTSAELEEAMLEYQALYGEDVGRAQYMQEYMVDWNAAILGAFYAFEMVRVHNERRIAEITAVPGQAVHHAWDLGMTDDTSIWFYQVVGTQLFILDHYSASGVGLEHYRDIILDRHKTHGWKHGTDYVPHDAKVKEWASGRTRIETMQWMGLRPEMVPNVSLEDGRNAVRRTLPLCVFHPRCGTGIDALEQYRREWDDERKAFKASAVHDWTSHPCLTGDTLVDLDRGRVPIKDVRIGDMAWTPCGYAKVIAAGPTGIADELIEVTLADGRTLRGTGNHLVFTDRGLAHLDTLGYLDVVLSEGSPAWQRALSSSLAANTGFRDAIIAAVDTLPSTVICTGKFGNGLMARFQTAMTCITSMVMAPITSSPIWNWSSVASMPGSTLLNGSLRANLPRRAPWLRPSPPSGTPHRRGSSGTGTTASALGRIASGICSNVRNAVAPIVRPIPTNPNSVISIAKWRPTAADMDARLVYDLTVEKHHCYRANGVLVSNSDAFRYLSLSWRPFVPKPIKKPSLTGWRIPPPRIVPAWEMVDG